MHIAAVSYKSSIADLYRAVRNTGPVSPPPSRPPPNLNSPLPTLITDLQPCTSTSQLLISKLAPFHKHLTAAHINAQSLTAHIEEVWVILDTQVFDVFAVSESWLKPSISSRDVDIAGYTLYRNDRINKIGGGVAVYVRNNLKVKVLFTTPQEYTARPEFMFLEVGLYGANALLLGVCYRPPRIGHMTDFEDALLRILPNYNNVLIMGDLNTDLLKRNNNETIQLTDFFRSCNLSILPLNATHHTANTHTLLDLMVVSDPALSVCHGQISVPAISHHDLIFCALTLKTPKIRQRFITYRNFRVFSEPEFLADVYSTNWQSITESVSVDDMVGSFNTLLLNLYNKHAPLVKKRVNKKRPTPWLTDEIMSLMAKRDSVHRKAKRNNDQQLFNQYRRLRNQVKQQLRNSKHRYITSLFGDRNQTSTSLWRSVRKLGFGKQPTQVSIDIPLNSLNDYFTSFSQSSSNIDVQNYLTLLRNTPPANHLQFQFKPILPGEVFGAIQRIRSEATGTDNISISLVKRILFAIIPVLTTIFNNSLQSSIFPDQWKSASIRPLNKIPSPSSPQDFRPISILPAISKAFERLVHCQISDYLNSHKVLNSFQSGFRKNHSTETALIRVTDDIRSAMDRGQCTILALFDFSKAFDTVNHSILIEKLKIIGFSANALSWMGSYLSGRRQCVCHDNNTSDWLTVTSGVPQGSILGPLLFTIYVNDIHTVLRNTKFHSYADDLQIYTHFKADGLNDTVALINDDITRLLQWSREHGLKLNPDKTQPILIAHARILTSIDINIAPKIIVNDIPLAYQRTVKSLGLIINNKLEWSEAVTNTCNKVFAAMHALKKMKRFLPFHIKLLLVKTLVFPHFNYCSTVINDLTMNLNLRLQKTQNYCIRYLFELQRDEHITPYYLRLSILKQSEHRLFRTTVLLYSILDTRSPIYLSDVFEFVAERSERENRTSSSILRIPHHRTAKFNKSFTVTACRSWNLLPNKIKTLESRAQFAAALKRYLLDKMAAGVRT